MRKKQDKKRLTQVQSAPAFNFWGFALLLFSVTALAYWPAWFGQPIWDDDAHLTKLRLRSLAGLAQIWTQPGATQQYYPLVHSVFWIEHRLWGDTVWPYHAVNISLHVIAALLLLKILRDLKVPGAWLAAAIFALHPVHVESVAWMSELKNTLSAVFFLGAVAVYLRFDQARNKSTYFIALCLFAFGLLSKTVIATLPAVLLVVFWWKRGRLSWKRDFFPLLPFFVLGTSAGLFTAWVEHKFIGAQGEAFDFGFIERLVVAGRAFWFYLGKLLWPANLTFIYPRWEVSRLIWWQYLFPSAAFLLFAALWILRKRWRGPLAAFLLFAGILFPVLGFVNVYPFIYSFVADHFQYLASIGVIVLIAAGITLLLERWNLGQRVTGYVICLVPIAILIGLTWRQSHIYIDRETLYRTTIDRNPGCWMAHNNLAISLLDRGHLDEAISHCERALQIRPEYPEAELNFGNALLAKNLAGEAVAHYQKALELRPAYAQAHNSFGNALLQQGRYEEGIAHYEKAIVLEPRDAMAKNNLAWVLAACPEMALRDAHRAVELAASAEQLSGGTSATVLHTLAFAYAQTGQISKAIATAQRALQLADAQGNTSLASLLRREMTEYRSHLPSL